MTTNGVNSVEEADMMECDGEKVVTMMDVLQEQQEFEDDANAVLGASDDKECTYSKGYIKRQALYACLTCCSGARDDPSQRAGVCLACSLNCHENHELIELYTKRNFRCDCGNPKFRSHPCQFTPMKTDLNEDNSYNQNFSGIYCICNRPYPDPEASVEEEMIQCIICEDWLHSTHLEATVPAHDLYSEMICKGCMENNEFLHDYSQIAVNYEPDVDVTTTNESDKSVCLENNQWVNGVTDCTETPDIEINNENVNIENDSKLPNEENQTTPNEDKDMNSNDESTSIQCTTESSEKLEINECDSKVPTDNELPKSNSNSVIEPKQDIALDDQSTKNIENEETKPITDKPHDTENNIEDNVDHEIPNLESESTKELKENVTEPNSIEQENVTTTNDNLIVSSEMSEENNILENGPNEDDSNAVSVSTNSENIESAESNNSSEKTENVSEGVVEKTITGKGEEQTNNAGIDSLEAATKELSELMDEGESNQSSTNTKELATTSTDNDPKVQENGLKDKEINNETEIKLTNDDTKVPDNLENENKRKLNDSTDEKHVKKQKLDNIEDCLRPKGVKRTLKGATFWPSNFRQKLCTCNNCLSMYKDLNVLFLTDAEDTVTAYETLGKQINNGGPATQYEKGLEALSSLDRVQQINALTEYNKMRDKLLDFLKSFKDRKEIVKEEDIKAFFAGMKPRREPDGVYFCR